MKQRFLYSLLSLLAAIVVTGGAALAQSTEPSNQQPEVRGSLSPEEVEVGDQFEYTLDIFVDIATPWVPPTYGKSLSKEERKAQAEAKRSMATYTEYNDEVIEVIKDYPIDTIKVEGRRLHLRKRYRFAAMETGEIPFVPAISYYGKNRDLPDTLYGTDTLRLRVKSYEELDTTLFIKFDPNAGGIAVDSLAAREKLRDDGLYEQKDLPFIFAEIRDYVIYGSIGLILLALLIWLVVWLVRRHLRNRKAKPNAGPVIPPHVVANKALVELGHRKLWQKGKYKAYYTALSSILRTYISGRWGVGAMEMTTAEIFDEMKSTDVSKELLKETKDLFDRADFVKFAKYVASDEDNASTLPVAVRFVTETYQAEVESETPVMSSESPVMSSETPVMSSEVETSNNGGQN